MVISSARLEANSGKSPLEHVVAFLTATPVLVSGIYIWVTLFIGVIAFASISTLMSQFGFSEESSIVVPLVFSLSLTGIAIAIIALGRGVIRLKTLEPPEEPSEVGEIRGERNQANVPSNVLAQNTV